MEARESMISFLKVSEAALDQFIESTTAGRMDFIRAKIRPAAWPKDIFRLPRFQSHRGFWKDGHRQNSIASLEAAARHGAAMCEFDVRLTKDRVPVLFHDESLESVGFPDLRVDELSLQELRAKTPVDTLREVLRSRNLTPYFNIELKSEKVLNDPLERYVAQVVTETKATHRVLFSSFNPISIWKMQGLLPEVPRALLVSPDMDQRSLREMWLAPILKIHMLNLDDQMVTAESMQVWKDLRIPIAVWTVNSETRNAELYELGVDSIISDLSPDLFAEMV